MNAKVMLFKERWQKKQNRLPSSIAWRFNIRDINIKYFSCSKRIFPFIGSLRISHHILKYDLA